MLGLLSAGIAPGLALLSYFYLKDQYETEPLSMVFKTFIFGAILVFPISFIQYVLGTEQLIQLGIIKAFLSTSLLEEFLNGSYCFSQYINTLLLTSPMTGLYTVHLFLLVLPPRKTFSISWQMDFIMLSAERFCLFQVMLCLVS